MSVKITGILRDLFRSFRSTRIFGQNLERFGFIPDKNRRYWILIYRVPIWLILQGSCERGISVEDDPVNFIFF